MNLIDEIRPFIEKDAKQLLIDQPEDFTTLREAIESTVESLIDDLDDLVREF